MEVARLKPQLKKNLWKPEEDLILKNYVETHGEGNWATVSKRSGLMRGGKSCRLRWKNYLRPNIKRGEMSKEEEDLIVRMHRLLGNRWSLIAGRLPGRTDNEVKNYWNTHLNKKSLIIGKRKTTEPERNQHEDNNENINNEKKSRPWCHSETSGSALLLTRTGAQSPALDERNNYVNKEEKDEAESRVTDPWINMDDDPNNFNCEIEYPMLIGNSNNSGRRFVFDDEPLLAYLDSCILFEAFGCEGESGRK